MTELKLISADSHVNEPGDLWLDRIDQQFRDRAARVVENPPGQRPGGYPYSRPCEDLKLNKP